MIKEIDLLVKNAFIVTMNKSQPHAEALAVHDCKILAVGSNSEITKKYSNVKKILDLEGKFLCPGFNDTHTHLLSMAAKSKDVTLDKVRSPKEALEKIKERVKITPKGKWVFGDRWDESNWDDKRYLTLEELDEIAPDNPLYIRRVCGHMAVVNTLGFKELEIPWDEPDLEIDPKTKKPTGVIASPLSHRVGDNPKLKKTQKDIDEAIPIANELANSLGITSIADNLPIMCVKSYISARNKNQLTIRVNMNIPRDSFDHYLEAGIKSGFGDDILKIGGVKMFTDGSLGARTAKLYDAYYDDSSSKGDFYIEKEVLHETVLKALENDWQTVIHAIGDEAIDMVITTFEKIDKPDLTSKGRHRIEHAEYLLEKYLARANKLGIILSMQPNFPGRWGRPGQLYEIRLGSERYKLLNNFRKIIDSNAKLVFGSDNMPLSPLFGIWSVVTHPIDAIKITVEEAIYHYTLEAAYSSFEENIKGSLEVGKLADFVVLDKNLYQIDPEAIKDVQVLMTFFGGELVFEK
ncbi:MAG: amidohydrolase [Candidatus Heimdallarchaeota archaeon]|nr:amidohydrolase [Candidatus Heimdallarchaeota archaeon]MBY8993661.1 amidohydrolase [Candidatus Heimdallarchaeota archaeon]